LILLVFHVRGRSKKFVDIRKKGGKFRGKFLENSTKKPLQKGVAPMPSKNRYTQQKNDTAFCCALYRIELCTRHYEKLSLAKRCCSHAPSHAGMSRSDGLALLVRRESQQAP